MGTHPCYSIIYIEFSMLLWCSTKKQGFCASHPKKEKSLYIKQADYSTFIWFVKIFFYGLFINLTWGCSIYLPNMYLISRTCYTYLYSQLYFICGLVWSLMHKYLIIYITTVRAISENMFFMSEQSIARIVISTQLFLICWSVR